MNNVRILLVDNEPDLSVSTAAFLEARHYKVDVVHTGREALKKIYNKPDLVLLGRTLTDMDGLEICRRIREDKELRRMPIILMSNLCMPSHKSEGLHLGADDYVAKPFDNDELLARINAVLRRQGFAEGDFKDRQKLMDELSKILEFELIRPHFQPIFFLESHQLLGVEALSRPPSDSILSNPELLFAAAIKLGKYFELETLGWRKAIKQWKESSIPGKLILNCSPYFIEDGKFDQEKFIKEIGVSPNNIVLEITERMAVMDYKQLIGRLLKLKKAGFEFSVDDVGSGYAALETIAELKPNLVKIDISLVRNIHKDTLKRNIVEAIIAFCKKSHIITIAEGVEKAEELKTMQKLGTDAAQGYFLAKPSPEISDYSWVKF